jgi:outer membrane protein OmpA-like peptidoglycan-associated protein
VLLGAGAGVSTETNFLHSYGVEALAGLKFKINDKAALRVDGVWDWLANEDWKSYQSVRAGITLYRHPNRRVQTVVGPTVMQPSADSVSAAETRRLRESEAALRALRDSLRNAPPAATPTEVAAMEADIRFGFDESVLTDSAKRVLDGKVEVFRANPEMGIVIVGHSDLIGTDDYNMSLGSRRAAAAKAYIVSRGIAESRVTILSRGMTQPTTNSPGVDGQAPNRRAMFRLLVAPPDGE